MSSALPPQTHYDALNLPWLADFKACKTAYQKILLETHPDILQQNLGPFGRSKAKEAASNALKAWTVLSNAESKKAYDAGLPIDQFPEKVAKSGNSGPSMKSFKPHKNDKGSSNGQTSNESTDDDTAPASEEATYRYMATSTGTVVDIAISDWRLHLNLSSKFRFNNDVTELTKDQHDNSKVSLAIGLARDLSSPETSHPTINEATLIIQHIPDRMRVTKLQTLFKECAGPSPTTSLIVSITADAAPFFHPPIFPWEFGFDFDKNQVVRGAEKKGTCLIFEREKPPDFMQTYQGADSPDWELKRDKQIRADAFAELYSERVLRIKHGVVEMWRVAAVGYRREGRW